MSKFSKKTLAAALVAALAVPSAYAFVVHTDGNAAPEVVATEVGSVVTMTESVEFTTELTDIVIGRTTGVQLLVTLLDGAQFTATPPALSVGAGVTGTWTAALAAGGTDGSSVAQFTFSPDTPGSTIDEGVFAEIIGLSLKNVSTTGPTRLRVEVRDPVSAVTLHDETGTIITRESGLAASCTPTVNPLKIDVGTNSDFQPRTGLVDAPYEIGGADYTVANLGEITLSTSSGFTFGANTEFGSTITSNGSLEGFSSIWLDDNATCDGPGPVNYTIDLVNNTASFSEDGLLPDGTTSITQYLCVEVDGTTPIEAQQFTVTGSVNGAAITTACPVAPLQYNGSLVKVYHVNPAGNTQAQSFVRVINQSNNAGTVTVHGWDDAGNARGPISFTLGARQSKQFNSNDLENGSAAKGITGSFGSGTGKWRLEVLGEFDNMMVQGLNRNNDTGTVTNLTDADAQLEQDLLHRTTF